MACVPDHPSTSPRPASHPLFSSCDQWSDSIYPPSSSSSHSPDPSPLLTFTFTFFVLHHPFPPSPPKEIRHKRRLAFRLLDSRKQSPSLPPLFSALTLIATRLLSLLSRNKVDSEPNNRVSSRLSPYLSLSLPLLLHCMHRRRPVVTEGPSPIGIGLHCQATHAADR